METISILKDLAIIILFAKTMGIIARKLKAPMVVGEILAGLVMGPCLLGIVQLNDFLAQIAEIGVIMIMFSAGLETDMNELVRTGPIATIIALCGVFIPLGCGALLYQCVYGFAPWGSESFYRAVFIGTIMTATSVSITVESLREMGKLSGKIGTTILSAAIIDDIIGIIVLTVVIGFKDSSQSVGQVLINTVLFFVFAIGGGLVAFWLFNRADQRYPHTRRIPIMSLALCFLYAYVAEKFFGIADITGAYAAGIILSSMHDSDYVQRKMDINTYMIFGPVFFCSIGLRTDIQSMDMKLFIFSVLFVIVAMASKVIGCGLISKVCKFTWRDSLKIGVGMMTRGEVALIVTQKGLNVGMVDAKYFASVILLIIVSSIATPIILKILYAADDKDASAGNVQEAAPAENV